MTTSTTLAPLTVRVALPSNIVRIDRQDDLYGYGVVTMGYVQVSDEAEAVERAEGRRAFLLKSPTLPCFYLIFPHVIVEPYRSRS
jgi:hypothetical protein